MQTKQQQQEDRHMNSELTTSLFPFMKAQVSAEKQVSQKQPSTTTAEMVPPR